MRHAQTGPTGATTTATSAGLAAFRSTVRTRFASTPFGFGSVSKSFGGGGGRAGFGGAQATRLSVRCTHAPGATRVACFAAMQYALFAASAGIEIATPDVPRDVCVQLAATLRASEAVVLERLCAGGEAGALFEVDAMMAGTS